MFPSNEALFLSLLTGTPFKLAKPLSGSNRWRFVTWALKNGVLEDTGLKNWSGTDVSYLVKMSFIAPVSNGMPLLQKAGNRITFGGIKVRK